MFEALGLTDTEEAVYVALLTGRGSTADEIAREIGVGDSRPGRPSLGSRTSASSRIVRGRQPG